MTTGTIIEFRLRERAGQVPARKIETAENATDCSISPLPATSARPSDREVTHARWRTFLEAEHRVRFYEALIDAARYGEHLRDELPDAAIIVAFRHGQHGIDCPLLAQLRKARAELVLTPVCNKAQLAVKRQIIKFDGAYLGLKADRIAAAVAADEAYTAIPKHKRADAIRRKAVQL
ncbi:MAG: hypothetical protein JSR61_02620 [Proteobacteria bacterium]|nr:hypothetical protein [Pseudomonadota bacterium]